METQPTSFSEGFPHNPSEPLSDEDIVRMVEQERTPAESRAPLIAFCGVLASCLFILPLAYGRFQGARMPPPKPTPRWVNWTYSFEEAQSRAQSSHQKILIDFYTDWCPNCKWMDTSVYVRPEVLGESTNVVTAKINADGRPDLARRYNIHVLPSQIWTDASGNEVARHDGSLSSGQLAELMYQNRRLGD